MAPATSATRPRAIGSRGVTAAMIVRRTWKGPKEPTRHVGVDAIAAVSVARPLRADPNGTVPPGTGARRPVHGIAATSSGYPPSIHMALAGGASRDRVDGVVLTAIPGEDEVPADQLGLGHDIGVGDPPGHGAVRVDSKGLELGLDEHVGQS